MSEPRNFIKITSPVGTLQYPQSLQKPNTKFDPEGVWQADLILTPEEGLAFKDKIQEIFDEQISPAVIEYNKLKKKVKVKDLPIEEDEETGNLIFKLKMKTKTGSGKKQRPIIVDELGKPLDPSISLASGTKAKVGIQLYGWYSPALGMGVRLEPKAVSVTEVVEYQADSGFGFEIDSKAYQNNKDDDVDMESSDGTEAYEDDEEDF